MSQITKQHGSIDLNAIGTIDANDSHYWPALARLQGNILKSHGRDHVRLLFLRFDIPEIGGTIPARQATVKTGIAALARRYVTSAARQHQETEERRVTGGPGRLFGGVYLSAQGYRRLGITTTMASWIDADNGPLPSSMFWLGMQDPTVREALNDPELHEWQLGYGAARIDAMVLLAYDEEPWLQQVLDKLVRPSLLGIAHICAEETGVKLTAPFGPSNDEYVTEHFGFRDGISQPLFYQGDLDKVPSRDHWDPLARLSLVLKQDPLAGPDHFGSYLVYRKLGQKVKEFGEQSCAKRAEIIGRQPNGRTLFDRQPPHENDFDYDAFDPAGEKCAWSAHIRKTNPRGEGGARDDEVDHRIVRRGVPYGRREDDVAKGLLFMCFQSNLAAQFGHLQANWANQTSSPRRNGGPDQLIGQGSGDSFKSFVTMRGGEFFFAPSIPFLLNLARNRG